MKLFSTLCAALSLAAHAQGHMQMKFPPPLRSSFNSYTTNIDYDMVSPLNANGANFPCKGYHSLMGTPQARSVATWTQGKSHYITITGGTPHNGGSCQISLSYDRGKTFKVVHSFIGNCPVMGESSYRFTLPFDTPPGQALMAWTWFNNLGNREMYMNCAVITIKAAQTRAPAVAWNRRPPMFVANVNNNVCTWEGTDVLFPRPGPNVTRNTKKAVAPGTGRCERFGGP